MYNDWLVAFVTYSVLLIHRSNKITVSVGKEVFWVIKKYKKSSTSIGFEEFCFIPKWFWLQGKCFLFLLKEFFYDYFLSQITFLEKKIPTCPDRIPDRGEPHYRMRLYSVFSVQCSREVDNYRHHGSFTKWMTQKELSEGPVFTNRLGPNQ